MQPLPSVAQSATVDLAGARILIVDDDQEIRDLLAVALSRAGATTAVARGVDDAITAFGRCRPDVVVSDLVMPEEDGQFLIRMLRSLPPDQGGRVPAIAISAHDDQVRSSALDAGFDEYVPKPFEVPDLIARIRNRLGREEDRMPCGAARADPPPSPPAELEALREAVRARDEFISTLGHELRNPLSPIFLQLHVLLDKLRSAEGGMVSAASIQGDVERVLRRCKSLLETMNRILDASALSTGRLALVLDEVDLSDVARTVCLGRERELTLARCELRFSAPVPVVGRWDKVRLEQVVENLVSNAIRYGAGGPIDVTVTGNELEGCVSVRDHGPGIAPEDAERIFGQFERAIRRTKAGSFGIGLWVVRGICEALGGSIHVDSPPGEGATFKVRLPRRPQETPT